MANGWKDFNYINDYGFTLFNLYIYRGGFIIELFNFEFSIRGRA